MKKENRGGAREGSGRKKKTRIYSDKVKKAYIKAAAKLAKEHGKSIEEVMLSMIYDPKVVDVAKASVLKIYNEALLVKESEQELNVNRSGPGIYLPQTKSDPAKLIPIQGKKNGTND
jgi:hypothetical protein